MSVTTIRPTSTVANGTSSIGGGAGSRHAALSDDSDTTYVDLTGHIYANAQMVLGFSDPGLAADDVVTLVFVRAKAKVASGTATVTLGTYVTLGAATGSMSINLPTAAAQTLPTLYGKGDVSSPVVGFWRAGGPVAARLYEVYFDVHYIAQPTVVVNVPNGTLTESNRPTVLWTPGFDADSSGQYAYQVRVFTDAQYGAGGFSPDTSTAFTETPTSVGSPLGDVYYPGYPLGKVTSWPVPVSLPNDTYRAYVRVANKVGDTVQWSAWDYEEFTVNVSPPDAPALALTDQPSDLRVKIDVTPDNSPVATDGVVVERSADGGTTWEAVGTGSGGSPATFYDYFMPSGVSVSYRAAGWNDTASSRLYSAFTTASVTPTAPWRIIHPTDPALNFTIDDRPGSWLRSNPAITRAARRSIQQPLNRPDAVVISDSRAPASGSVTVAMTKAKLDELNALLDSGASALWLAGREGGWDDRWVSFADTEETRLVDKSWVDLYDVTLPWDKVSHADG